MRYQGTAVQIYDMPSQLNPDMRFDRRLALAVAALGLLGLVAFAVFVLFGIVSQRL